MTKHAQGIQCMPLMGYCLPAVWPQVVPQARTRTTLVSVQRRAPESAESINGKTIKILSVEPARIFQIEI